MIKIMFYVLSAVVLLVLAGSGIHLYRVAQKNEREMEKYMQPVKPDVKTGKTLVVYYSLSGHTRKIAEKVAALTGGDLYEIKTEEKIKPELSFYLKARRQLKNGKYPALAGEMPDIKSYDTVFVGAPVWWYAPATPLLSFLKKADFAAKKVVPFSTQGSNFGSFFADFNKMAQNAKMRPSASFNNLPEKYDRAVDNKITVWVNSVR